MMYYIKKEVKTMKKNKIYIFIAVLFAAFFSACSEDDLSSESVITEAQRVENDFDRWIVKNYVTPYNIVWRILSPIVTIT